MDKPMTDPADNPENDTTEISFSQAGRLSGLHDDSTQDEDASEDAAQYAVVWETVDDDDCDDPDDSDFGDDSGDDDILADRIEGEEINEIAQMLRYHFQARGKNVRVLTNCDVYLDENHPDKIAFSTDLMVVKDDQ